MSKTTSVLSVALAATASLVLTIVTSSPHADELAAVFPPWWSPARAFKAAGGVGDIVGIGFVPFIIVVHSMPADLAARLRRSGALITLDARAFVACGTPHLEPAQ